MSMSVDRSVALGVEVAGGKATVALIDSSGCVLHRCHAKTLHGRPAAATLELYLHAVDAMYRHAHEQRIFLRGIGVSIPGSLDVTQRRPLVVPTLPALNGFPLCELFEARYQIPARLYVDVDAALLGEHRFGVGRGFSRVLFLTVNAVVGAALLIDDQLVHPEQQSVGHVCHMSVSTNGPRCSCGKRGCISTLVSMDAVQRSIQRALRRGDESSLMQRLLKREYFSPQLLAEEAARGDCVALQVYNEMGRWLSAAVTTYVNLFGPNVLILGGEVLSTSEVLLSRVRSALATSPSSRVCSMVEAVPALLGNDAMLIGAATSFL